MASAPGIPNTPVNLNLFLQISKSSLPFKITPGEVLVLDVVEKLPNNQYLMNMKGAAITIKSEAPLQQGGKLQVKVQSVQPQLVLQAIEVQEQATDVRTENHPQRGSRPGALLQVLTRTPDAFGNMKINDHAMPPLAQGQTLTVTVQEKLPGNQYMMALKGTMVAVKSETPLATGDKLPVRVQSVQPQLVLQLLEPQEQAAGVKTNQNQIPKEVQHTSLNQGVTKTLSSFDNIKTQSKTEIALSPGQTLTVTVQEKLPGNQYQIAVRNTTITATSDIPLKEGEKLQVKVQSLQPQIILTVTDASKQALEAKVNEKLIQWRINPESMAQVIEKSSEFAQNLKSVSLPSGFSGKDAEVLLKILNNIVFSPKTKSNPLFVKDFITKTGLMLERDLSSLTMRKFGENPAAPADNLKASLLKLSDALSLALQDTTKFDDVTVQKLLNLTSFTSDALKTVETGQTVNVVYQQNENGLYLQIPLSLGEMYRQADIFIRPDDKNASDSKKYSSCSVSIFLDLDYLGEMAIEAGVREGRIHCIIKCEKEETRELLDASSQMLRDALTAIGYGVDRVECMKTSDLAAQKAEFIGQQILGTTDLVNSYA